MWNPVQYQRFGDERARPFYELVSQIPELINGAPPRQVVDLGCGDGPLTASLMKRWPTAEIVGIDSDAAMLDAASSLSQARLSFTFGDLRTWSAIDNGFATVDVVLANAALQWDLDHLTRLPHTFAQVSPGGYLAFQVPGNLDDPHHQAIRSLRAASHWRDVGRLASLPPRTHVSFSPLTYLSELAKLGAIVNAWETSYVHVLHGLDPILEWVKGTGLRPVLNALESDEDRDRFCAELAPLLREAYPSHDFGTPFPFRRVFVVAQKPQ
jgi:trans-aconitate 2-methyltransferase